MIRNVVDQNLLPEESYRSTSDKMAASALLQKILLLDQLRMEHMLKGSDEPCVLKIKISLLHVVVGFLIVFLYFILFYLFISRLDYD